MITICHINVRSLVAPGRLEELKCFLSMNDIDVLCLTETWLTDKHLNSTILLSGFQPPLRKDRVFSRGGGVAKFLRKGLAFSPVLHQTSLEALAVRIHLPKRKSLTVFSVYRPPRADIMNFLESFDLLISPQLHTNVCMASDFNGKHSFWYKMAKPLM